jgi:hypothetical protein
MPIERYLLKVVAKCADRYNLYFETPEGMKRKINILKVYYSRNRRIEYSIVLPCLIVNIYEQMEKTINKMKMKRAISVDQFNKSVAGGLTVGTIDDIINGISQYANVSVNHFIFHFLLLDQSVLKKFSRMIKICMTFC